MDGFDLRIIDLARDLLWTALVVAAPALVIGLLVGICVSLFQALTSIQEQTMSLVPKMLAVMAVTLILLAPALELLRSFTERIFHQLVDFGLA